MVVTGLTIRNYQPSDQPHFEKLNREWIESLFVMEPVDVAVLSNPEKHILNQGGYIIMAEFENQIVGTVALKPLGDHTFELTKMAVLTGCRGRGIGRTLAETALHLAHSLDAHRVVLYSSTRLRAAIELYKKLGFREIPLDGPYKRSDIKMKLLISDFTIHDKSK